MGVYDNRASLSGSLSLQVIQEVAETDYNNLDNLPTINGVLLKGNVTTSDLGIERGYDAQVDPEDDEHLILST